MQLRLFFFVILFLSSILLSNDSVPLELEEELESLLITSIEIQGNTHTKDVVILRELKMQTGDVYDPELMQEDQNRIRNLNLFSRVEIIPVYEQDGILIQIIVAERWHVFPYPILYRNERDWSKISYGAGLLHDNFRGLKNMVMASFWLGYNPGADIYYSNPWFGGKHHFYYKFRAYVSEVKNKGLDYNRFKEKHKGGTLTFGKRWGYHTYMSMDLGYRQIIVPADYQYLSYSGNGIDHLPSMGIAFRYDSRDLWEYPKNGIFIDLYAKKTMNNSNIDYFRYGLDLRKYFSLFSGISIAFKSQVDMSTGSIPAYDRIYLGYAYRIRGEFDTHMEGDNRAIGSVELRFPIIPIQYFDIAEQGYDFGAYSSNLPFGLSGGVFYDTGTTWFKSDFVLDKKRLNGFGFGLHFHVPYVQLLRLEYAWNSDFEPQLIADIGVAF